ncbi:hypothetical protein K4F52_005859 [Lecanicillium sp. MT-2017a]|nr:hypothetical protein K4F52_005859 [Lecanicillium sp. MT-2017a]
MRSNGMLYYDYSEEFKRQTTARADLDAPVCPIPKRTGSNEQPLILREDTLSRLDSIASSVGGSGNGSNNNMGARGRDLNSIDEFCDSYMEDSHGESIREIEKVLANAISSVAADQSLMSTLRAADARYSQRLFGPASVKPATVRNGPDTATSSSSNDWAIPQKAWRQSKTVAAEPGYALSQAGNRSSKASLCKKDFSLDPVFADFTSLLSSFERLAKSPFSRLSDEDDLDEENKRLSRRLTLELLDRVASESKPYQRCHRRNHAARDIRISELSGDDSLSGNRISSEGTTVLAPEPLSPSRQPPTKNAQDLQLMKALPPLPGERLPWSCADENQASQTGVDNVRQASPKGLESGKDTKSAGIAKSPLGDKKAHRQSPLKLKLRINASRSSIDAETPDTYGAPSHRNSVDEGRLPSTSKAPPRLKLKVSRTQLNQGRNNTCETIIRNNRLKQCNALADVAPPPRLGGSCQPGAGEETSADAESPQKAGTLDIIEDEARQWSPGTLSDQFNLVYPPTPPDTVEAGIQNSTSTGKLIVELPASHSDIGHVPSRRLRSKFSFLRPRNTTAVGPTLTADETNADTTLQARDRAASMEGPTQFFGKVTTAASTSAKSERVGVKMRRWATDAKRAVRLYVRRTLVRGPKKANQEVQM